MDVTTRKSVALWELAAIGVTRGAIGFGAGLLAAGKLAGEKRRVVGLSLLLAGLASTVPIAWHLFGKRANPMEPTSS